MTLWETTKGAQASTESERNVQPWEPFGNFAGRVSFRGALHNGPARAAGNPNRPHSRLLCRNSLLHLHPVDLIKSGGATEPPTAWKCLLVHGTQRCCHLRDLLTRCPLTLGLHNSRVQMVISCPGRLDPGYRSVILYAERIMVSPMTAWPSVPSSSRPRSQAPV